MVEGSDETLVGVVEFARLVLLDAERELLARALAQHVIGDLRRYGLRLFPGGEELRAAEDQKRPREERPVCNVKEASAHSYWNLWRTVNSSRALRSRFSTCMGKVELRTSMRYLPGSSLIDFMGGVTPRDLPFTKISPHGETAHTKVAGGSAEATFTASGLGLSTLVSLG